jgi:hypothetical protein
LKTNEILEALIALADDKIWATELALVEGWTSRRVDFWTLEVTASARFRATAHEIKVSREDFKNDGLKKQSRALEFSDRFWYVTPLGLLKKEEIPEWAGLMEWDGAQFRVKKRAPQRMKAPPTWAFVVSLMRNCSDSRRDQGLMKAQLAFYEFQWNRGKKHQEIRNKNWMARRIGVLSRIKK